jgi:hypothetical protein
MADLASDKKVSCHKPAPNFVLERRQAEGHNSPMISNGFRILGYLVGLVALYAMWLDLTMSSQPSIVLGQFWFERHATSLQVTEAIVSRYVDPCGLIMALGCEPFLWHPMIVTLLGWPTAIVLLLVMAMLLAIARLIRGRGDRKIRGRDLKRRGER